MPEPDLADARDALRHALGRFLAVLKSQPSPNLHAVIVEAPHNDHPRLYPGADRPPLPVNLRAKRWLNAFYIPLIPAAKIHYFGDGGQLGPFRDLSRVALAALRRAFPDVDEAVRKIQYCGPQGDADHVLADYPLLLLRNLIGDNSPSRQSVMDRWHWTDTAGLTRVPYYEDERRALGRDGPTPPEAADAPNVTIFTDDVFSFSASALNFALSLLPEPGEPTGVPTAGALGELARLALAFDDAVDDLPYDGRGPVNDLESRIARAAAAAITAAETVKALDQIPGMRPLPTDAGRAIRKFESTLKAQIGRWGWSFILAAASEARIADKLAAHCRDRWLPVLAAARAWRTDNDLEPNRNADDLLDQAIELGVEPLAVPPREAEERTWNLHRDWWNSPALGPGLPTLTDAERSAIKRAVAGVGRYAARPATAAGGTAQAIVPPADARPPAAAATDPPAEELSRPGPESKPHAALNDEAPRLSSASRALAAALDLKKEGRAVTLKAACDRAGVDRKNLRQRHPGTVEAIRSMAAPDRPLPRGVRDRRTGGLDAIDGDDD